MAEPLAAMTTRWIARARGPECLQIFITGASGHQGFPYNTHRRSRRDLPAWRVSGMDRTASMPCRHAPVVAPKGQHPRKLSGKRTAAARTLWRESQGRCCIAPPHACRPGRRPARVMTSLSWPPKAASGGRRAGTAPGFAEGYDLRHRYRGGGFSGRRTAPPRGDPCDRIVAWRCQFWSAPDNDVVLPVLANTGRWRGAAGPGRYRPCPCEALLICGVAARLPPFRSLHSLSLETLPWHKYPAI